MQYGICTQATVPVRETPSHKSQMTNQLLFGDLIYVKELQNGWALTETFDDNYEGWIEMKQITQITREWFLRTEDMAINLSSGDRRLLTEYFKKLIHTSQIHKLN